MLIEKQKEEVLSEIEMMPKEQQEYIDLYNNLEVSQALYEELESRRLGFSILEASTIGDIRVVDAAYIDSLVSPKFTTVVLFTFLAFIFACIYATFRGFYFLPISNPAEIFDNGVDLPIIGVIPHVDDLEFQQDDLRLNTAIEALIVNINSIQNNQLDKKILTITSPSPTNGKSTISVKLAEGLSKIGKKVLLVDNDLKRGKIASNYNIKSISKTFNSIDESTVEKFKVSDNYYVIPRVKGLSNTFQFLYSFSYKDKIKFFKDHFDFIIFDTGPILSVADSSVLIEQSDFNILIARHGLNRMNEIKQCIDNFKQINKRIDGIVYNAYAKPKVIMDTMEFMVIIHINIMLTNTQMILMNMKKKINLALILIFVSGCTLSPGMHMDTNTPLLEESKYVYIKSIDKNVRIINISEILDASYENNYVYKIGTGD